MALPIKALSIRQPWAWCIINAGKDIENRDWPTRYRGAVAIHAAKGMTRDEYEDCLDTCHGISLRSPFPSGLEMPAFEDLQRGGIVGVAEIVDCVSASNGPPPTEEHEAAHSCGKGHEKCVTPGHLSWKTPQENAADKIGHNTAQVGERHSRAKLTDANIREICAAPSSDGLAARFGVAKVTIRHIRSGRKWRHV